MALPSRDIGTPLGINDIVAQPTVPAGDPPMLSERVASEVATIRARIEAFVRTYNEVLWATMGTGSAGAAARLAANSTELAAQSRLDGAPTAVPSGVTQAVTLLSKMEIGVSVQRDGTLAIDQAKLAEALDDPTKRVSERFVNGATVIGSAERKGIEIELEAHYRQELGALHAMIASMAETRDFLQQQLANRAEREEISGGND